MKALFGIDLASALTQEGFMKKAWRLRFAALLSAVGALAAPIAHANTYDLTLTGMVANFMESHFSIGPVMFDQFFFPLSGLDSSNQLTVFVGDTINSTVTFDAPLTIPASQYRTDIAHYYFGNFTSFPPNDVSASGTVTFFDGATPVATFPWGGSGAASVVGVNILFKPDNGPLTFTSFTDSLTIASIPAPSLATLNESDFVYALGSTAVPEPQAWIMMLVGFGGMGAWAATARRRSITARARA
jgi:hypothetical protein